MGLGERHGVSREGYREGRLQGPGSAQQRPAGTWVGIGQDQTSTSICRAPHPPTCLDATGVGQQQQRAVAAVLAGAGVKGTQCRVGSVQRGEGWQTRLHADVIHCACFGLGLGVVDGVGAG